MQKWEYYAAWVFYDNDFRIPTGQKGLFGEITKKEPTFAVDSPSGERQRLSRFLAMMGEDGWEIVAAAQSWAVTGGPVEDSYYPAHLLYFKRPKKP